MKIYKDQLIVVTGGAGFIGSCVVHELNQRGLDNIVIVDELGCTEKWKNLVGKQFVDILEKEQLFAWLEKKESLIEAFIHLGACSSTVEADASYLLKNNYQYTLKLAEYALKHMIRFVYASSAATYGDGSQGFSDAHDCIEQLRPLNMYGYSKQLFDLWAKQQGVLDRITGLKFFNVFGPNEYHKERMASAIYHCFPKAKQEGVIRLFRSSEPARFKDGEQMRDFIYVKDVARMTCDFLESDACGIFNVGSGVPSTWNSLATGVFKALNSPVNIEYINMPRDLIGKYQNYSLAEMDKTSEALQGNIACLPLEDAIGDYITHYLSKGERL